MDWFKELSKEIILNQDPFVGSTSIRTFRQLPERRGQTEILPSPDPNREWILCYPGIAYDFQPETNIVRTIRAEYNVRQVIDRYDFRLKCHFHITILISV